MFLVPLMQGGTSDATLRRRGISRRAVRSTAAGELRYDEDIMPEPSSRSQPPDKPEWLQRSKSAATDAASDVPTSANSESSSSKTGDAPVVASSPLPKRSPSSSGKKRSTTTAPKVEPRTPLSFSVRTLRFLMGGSVEIGSIPMDLDARGLMRLWWKSNRTGFLVSAGLHGLLLLVFAVWALPRVLPANNFMLDGFSTTSPGGPAGTEGPIQINTKLTPADLPAGRGKSKNDAPDATNEKGSDSPSGGAVNPVAVGNALAGRGAGTGGEGGGGGGGGGGGKGGIFQGLGVGNKPPTGIAAGLGWLARHQEKGGNWKLHEGYPDVGERVIRTDAGATALALLALTALHTGKS